MVKDKIKNQLDKINISIDDEKLDKLEAYLYLLQKWNKIYNLTSIKETDLIIKKHLIDSLSVLPWIQEQGNLLDVGTGAGLPGIPLAICYPEKNIMLLDSNNKKTRFLLQCKTELKIKSIDISNQRIENLNGVSFNQIISRAFSSINKFLLLTENVIDKDGEWLAMKGVFPEEEISLIKKPFYIKESHKLVFPKTDEQRHLVILKKEGNI